MAMNSLFDENRRQEIRRAIALGRFQARKPAPEPPIRATNTTRVVVQTDPLDDRGYTPLNVPDKQLLKAAYGDDLVLAKDALYKGADPNVRDASSACATVIVGMPHSRSWGDTALMIASRNGNLELVRLLISYNADVNLDFSYGSCPFPTALSYARDGGQRDIEQALLAAGATR